MNIICLLAIAAMPASQAFNLSFSGNGDTLTIPSWDFIPSDMVNNSYSLSELSKPGKAKWQSWHTLPVSSCTIISCFHHIGLKPCK